MVNDAEGIGRAGRWCESPEVIAEMVRPELERIARRYMRDRSLVDDAVQEATLEVLATYESLRDPTASHAWLRLLVRKHADRITRRRHSVLDNYTVELQVDPSDGPDRLVERLGDIAVIRRALAVARDGDALLLSLRYLGEWTDTELAALLEAPCGTVRKRLHDARRRLRAAITTNCASLYERNPR